MITTTYKAMTTKGLVAVEIETRVCLGTEPTRFHDGDPIEAEIITVRIGGDEIGGPLRESVIERIGREDIEAESIEVARRARSARRLELTKERPW